MSEAPACVRDFGELGLPDDGVLQEVSTGWARWTAGPLAIGILRRPAEAVVRWRYAMSALDLAPEMADPEGDPGLRVAVSRGETGVASAHTADRDILFRPDEPLLVGAGCRATAWVSSPLWLRVDWGPASVEIPTWRPSDSWFGTPRRGQLCYASASSLRTDSADLPVRAFRARTRLEVLNDGAEPLTLTRVRVPVPQLALYHDGQNWITDSVEVRHDPRTEAGAAVVRTPPDGARLVSGPRAPAEPAVLSLLNGFFS